MKTVNVDKIYRAPKIQCKTTKNPIQKWKTDLIVLDNFNSRIPKKPAGIFIPLASAKISPFLALNFKIRRFLKKWIEHFSLSSKNLYYFVFMNNQFAKGYCWIIFLSVIYGFEIHCNCLGTSFYRSKYKVNI
jgi:hypothetical protein